MIEFSGRTGCTIATSGGWQREILEMGFSEGTGDADRDVRWIVIVVSIRSTAQVDNRVTQGIRRCEFRSLF